MAMKPAGNLQNVDGDPGRPYIIADNFAACMEWLHCLATSWLMSCAAVYTSTYW